MKVFKFLNKKPYLNIEKKPIKLLIASGILCLGFFGIAIYSLFFFQPNWSKKQVVSLQDFYKQDSVLISSDDNLLEYVQLGEELPLKIVIPKTGGFVYNSITVNKVISKGAGKQFVFSAALKDAVKEDIEQEAVTGLIYFTTRSEVPLYQAILK